MSKNIFIKLLICTIFIVIISNLFYVSSSYALGDIFADGKAFLETPGSNDISETINTTELEKTSDYIYNTLLAIGIMVAIVVAMVLGIQFMVASADEKAKVKEALMPFVVGCIVVFGAFTIWKIAVNIGNDAEKSIDANYKKIVNKLDSYESIMSIKEYQIDNMDKETLFDYLIKINNSLSAYADDKVKTEILKKRKEYVVVKLNAGDRYSEWEKYKGTDSDEVAYQRVIKMDINSVKTLKEVDEMLSIVITAKTYFDYMNDINKVEKLSEMYEDLLEKKEFIINYEYAGIQVPNTDLNEENIISNDKYYIEVKLPQNFVEDQSFRKKESKLYRDDEKDVNLDVKLCKGDVETYYSEMEVYSGAVVETKIMQVSGKSFKFKIITENKFVTYYVGYQIDDENYYLVAFDAKSENAVEVLETIKKTLLVVEIKTID